ncbi:MAG: hypothetical protein JSV08_07320 [Acidobacteriota bacterium]|nr:MAG: hypothetical protein JSV08_07320 [Acidobacteriota bacterium]
MNVSEAIEQLEAKAREVAGRARALREENARVIEENRLLRGRMEETEAGGVDRKAVAERIERCVQILEQALAEEGANTPE